MYRKQRGCDTVMCCYLRAIGVKIGKYVFVQKKIRLRVWNKGMSSFMLSKNIIFVNSEK